MLFANLLKQLHTYHAFCDIVTIKMKFQQDSFLVGATQPLFSCLIKSWLLADGSRADINVSWTKVIPSRLLLCEKKENLNSSTIFILYVQAKYEKQINLRLTHRGEETTFTYLVAVALLQVHLFHKPSVVAGTWSF